ncbi:CAP-GLY domain-containing linker protein 1 [Cichlidogyrus casuarinus]|uniref:CAP-GLY domain-containing linker protein 1 n=1 Tax=Cichlidogyrus casuarinus TaxID=1844966 RepID=A0ABD2QHS8_9PLAT
MLRTPKSNPPQSQIIIGSRVRVNKDDSKVGIVAFIGKTTFAPGEWIGINLDSPLGKNDGSVQGTQYFQADPNHGLFARIANVELLQIATSQFAAPSAISGTSTPATPKTSSASIPGRSGSFKLKIGDRVRTTGGRIGILRYCGPTEFASGFWAGIELDTPQGKNDGSVKGKRYFTCKPNHGLFANLESVQSMSDSQSGLRRSSNTTGSTSSLVSNYSAASKSQSKKATTQGPESTKQSAESLLHQIKEKDRHIEQLLQERDLERSEVAQVAAHNEEVEKELDRMRILCSSLKGQCEEYQTKIGALAKEKEQLVVKITEKSSAIEDMEFRLAEGEMEKSISAKAPEMTTASEPPQDLLSQCQNLNSHLPVILRHFSILRNDTQRSIQELHSNQSPEFAKNLLDTCLDKQNKLYEELKLLRETGDAQFSEEEHVAHESSSDVELQRLLTQLQTQEAELVEACMHLKEAEAKAAQAADLEAQIKVLEIELEQNKVELAAATCRETEVQEQKESAAVSELRCTLASLEDKLSTSNHKLQELTLQLEEAQKESKDFVSEVIAMLQGEAACEDLPPDSLLELRNWISLKTSQLSLQNEKAKSALAEAEASKCEWEKQLAALKEDLKQTQSDSATNLEKEKTASVGLQNSIEKLQKEKENLSLELEHSRKMHDENTSSVLATIEEEKSTILKAKDALEEEFKQMRENNQKISVELQKMTQQKETQDEELEALKLSQEEKQHNEAQVSWDNEKKLLEEQVEQLKKTSSEFAISQVSLTELKDKYDLALKEKEQIAQDLDQLKKTAVDDSAWRAALAEKDKDIITLKEHKTNSAALQSERKQNSELKKDIEALNNAKKSDNSNADEVQVTSTNGAMDQSQHVAFLNDIIASLHLKLESLQNKYDRLTTFENDLDFEDERKTGKSVKKIRVYCDVCEVFDAHETEACPVGEVEASEGQYIPSSKANKLNRIVAVRVYCEHCGVFDQHDSAECPEPSSF